MLKLHKYRLSIEVEILDFYRHKVGIHKLWNPDFGMGSGILGVVPPESSRFHSEIRILNPMLVLVSLVFSSRIFFRKKTKTKHSRWRQTLHLAPLRMK